MYQSKFTNIFRRFLISYIVILMIPLVTGFISYRVSIDIAKTNSIESSLSVLNQSTDILERRMAEVEGFTRQLAIDQDLNRLLSDNLLNNDSNISSLRKASQDLSGYARTNSFLQDFYIYLKEYNVILAPNTVFFRIDHFYQQNYYPNISFEQWKKTILEESHQNNIIPLRPFVRGGRETAAITYVQSLPLNSFNQPMGNVVVTIDEWKINNMLEGISDQLGGWAYIADREGNTLATMGIDESGINALEAKVTMNENDTTTQFLDDDTMLISVRSSFNDWFYVAGIPQETLTEQANSIQNITLTVTATTLIIGILISFILAYRNSNPIHRLMDMIRERVGIEGAKHRDGYDFLQGNISSLISNHKSLQAELRQQMPILRDAFIKRLINGEFNSVKGVEEAASQIDIELHGDIGYVGIVCIKGYEGLETMEFNNELHAKRIVIKQMLHHLNPNLNMTDLHLDQIVVIFTFGEEEDALMSNVIERMVADLSMALQDKYRISIMVSIGNLFRGYSDLSRSYDEARQSMDYAVLMNESGPVWYQDLAKETTMYFYPMDVELRFLNAIKVGKLSEAKRLLAEIFAQNFDERDLSTEMVHQLIGEIKATLLKSLDQKVFLGSNESEELRDQVARIQLGEGITQVWGAMEQVIETYCNLIIQTKKETDHNSVQTMLKYVEESYGDPNLTLHWIAEMMGRPEKFVSQLFKEHTGQYLSDYLEKVRIEKAVELLLNTNKTIEAISYQVGYNSPHSFRRAFKRLNGSTPNQYRQTINRSI